MHAEYFDHLFTGGVDTLITGADALTAQDSNMDDWNVHNCAALMRGRYDNFILHAKVHRFHQQLRIDGLAAHDEEVDVGKLANERPDLAQRFQRAGIEIDHHQLGRIGTP